MAEVALEGFFGDPVAKPDLANGGDDGGVVEFLGVVDFVATGVSASVTLVADVLGELTNGADDVAFHDLHVVEGCRRCRRGV